MQGSISDNVKVIYVAGAKDWNATECTTEWINLKNAQRVRWIINCGVLNASSSAAVTLIQATSDGGSSKAVSFDTYDDITGETVTATAVTSDTFNIVTGHSTSVLVIELDSSALDVTNGYDWVALQIASPGSYSTIYSVTAEVANMSYGTGSTVLA